MATSPTVILISKGSYPVVPSIPIPDDTLMWGACVRDTVIRTSTASTFPYGLIGAPGSGGAIGNLTVRSETGGVGVAGEGTDVLLRGILIDSPLAAGTGAFRGGTLRAERLVVRNVRRNLLDSSAVVLQEGSSGELSQVVIEGAEDYGIALEAASTATITDVRVLGSGSGGIIVRGACELTLERAAIESSSAFGMHAEGGRVIGSDVVVSGSLDLDDLSPGRGIAISYDGPTMSIPGSVVLDGALVERNTRTGIFLSTPGSTLELSDAVIRDTAPRELPGDTADGSGIGLHVSEGTTARVERVLLEGNHFAGVAVLDPGASLTATDLIVNDTLPGLTNLNGRAMIVRRTAAASVTRALFSGSRGNGVEVNERAHAVLDHVTIRDSAVVETSTEAAIGLLVAGEGTSVRLSHGRLERNQMFGSIVQEGASLELFDVTFAANEPRPSDGLFGMGLGVNDGARVSGARVAIEDNAGAGIATGAGATLELTDLAVRRTRPSRIGMEGDLSGRGLSLERGTTAKITNALIEENREIGLFVLDADVMLSNAAIVRTAPVVDVSGRGIQAQEGARIDLANVCLEDNVEVGVLASVAEVYGREVRVLGTKRNPCFEARTCELIGGLGLVAAIGGYIALSTFELAGNVETGVTIVGPNAALGLEGGAMDLVNGVVTGSKLGADVRDPSFDQSRITATVRYSGNEVDGVESRATVLPSTDTQELY
jgi:hypothetical protein